MHKNQIVSSTRGKRIFPNVWLAGAPVLLLDDQSRIDFMAAGNKILKCRETRRISLRTCFYPVEIKREKVEGACIITRVCTEVHFRMRQRNYISFHFRHVPHERNFRQSCILKTNRLFSIVVADCFVFVWFICETWICCTYVRTWELSRYVLAVAVHWIVMCGIRSFIFRGALIDEIDKINWISELIHFLNRIPIHFGNIEIALSVWHIRE